MTPQEINGVGLILKCYYICFSCACLCPSRVRHSPYIQSISMAQPRQIVSELKELLSAADWMIYVSVALTQLHLSD